MNKNAPCPKGSLRLARWPTPQVTEYKTRNTCRKTLNKVRAWSAEEGRMKLVGIQGGFQRDKWAFTETNKADVGEEHSRWETACRKAGTLDSSYCFLMPTLLGMVIYRVYQEVIWNKI